MRLPRASLGFKLNLALLIFVLVLGAAASGIVLFGFNRTQNNATERSRQALEEEGKLALQALAGGVSESGSLQFESAAEVGQRAGRYMQDFKANGGTPLYDTSRFVQTDQGVWYDPDPNRLSDVVVVNHQQLEGAVLDDIAYTAALDPLYPAMSEPFPGQLSGEAYNPIAIAFIAISGMGRYYPPIGVEKNTPPEVDVSDFEDRFGLNANPQRQTVWTPPYEDLQGHGLVITARTPVYDGDTFKGIFEVDLSIAKLVELVNGIKATPTGFTFYVDTDGGILQTDSFGFLSNEAKTNTGLAAILDSMSQPAAPSEGTGVTVQKLTMDGKEYFIAYTPMVVPGGSIGVAAPVDEVTAQAAIITAGIEHEGNRTFWIMLIAMAALFVAGLIGLAYFNRALLLVPLRRLFAGTQAVAAGDLDTTVDLQRGDELGTLADSFNTMVQKLRESERSLEQQVQERTRELTALLEVSRAVASTLDTQEVLGAILDQLSAVTEHTGASILLAREDAFEFVQARSITGARAQTGARIRYEVAPTLSAAMRRGETVIVDDVRSDEPMAADYRASINSLGVLDQPPFNVVRSWMAVPLALKDRVLGMLTISWTEPAYFTADHARLARAFADQAAAAIENSDLFEQTQAKTRELAALLEVSRALASTLDADTLVNVMLDQLRSVIDYSGAAVLIEEGNLLRQVALRRPPGFPITEDDYRPFPREQAGRLWERLLAEQLVVIPDVWADTPDAVSYRLPYGGDLRGKPVEYVHAFTAVPLMVRGEMIGAITLASSEPGYFNDRDVDLLRTFAGLAAAAFDNARLYRETRNSSRRFEALSRADSEIFRSLALDTVLQALVDVTVDVIGVDKSIVTTWDMETRVMSLRAWRNLNEKTLSYIRALFNRRTQSMDEPRVIVTEDPSRAEEHLVPIIESEGIQSMIEIPVVSSDGIPHGFFSVTYTTPHHFEEAEKQLLMALADRAAVAISNAELYARAQQVTALEERQRLARELHDSVSQALYGIALGARTARTQLDRDPAKAAEPVEYVLSLAEAGLAEMRALIFELRPESLESEGLVAALEKQVAATRARYGLEIDAKLAGEPDIPIEKKEALYRIAQEALHNVVKHAGATTVQVALTHDAGLLTLRIADNGAGFDPTAGFPGHLGLHSMRERADRAGASLRIDSAPGAGTTVTVTVGE